MLAVLCPVFVCSSYAAPAGVAKVSRAIEPFDYNGVSLDGGRLKAQFEAVEKEYMSIPNDDLLKGFRKRVGMPAPGEDLGGWYTADSFHIFGQILGGLSRMFAATGDIAIRDKVNYLISEWAKTIDTDGYFYYTNETKPRHYVYEKMIGGLLDAYQFCGNKDALKHLSRITDWAIKNLDRARNDCDSGRPNPEWYTLSENLYRAYLLTGDEKYKDFGAVWEYKNYWDTYAKNEDLFVMGKDFHAYSHANAVNGAATAYLVYGQSHYLDTLINGYDYLTKHQAYATGGYGPHERFMDDYQKLKESMLVEPHHFETQCGSWAVFKLVKYLITFTGDGRYGDWVELLTYNGIGASIPPVPAGGVQYWSNYNLYGAFKADDNGKWTCCAGSRPEAVADYYDLVWFKDASNLYVNLYTPATAHWNCKGMPVTVSQKGVLEEGRGIEFTVSTKSAVAFGLKFRVPNWIAGSMSVTVNGREFPAKADSKHWLVVDRTWANGDKVMVMLPLGLYAKRLDPAKLYPSAVMYGPIVLTGEFAGKKQASKLDMSDLGNKLIPASTGVAVFNLKADKLAVFRPFYTFGAGEEYFMYIDPHMTDFDKITYSGDWTTRGILHFSNAPDATAEAAFNGTGIIWKGEKGANGGKAEISIDGKVVAVVDQYSPEKKPRFEWKQTGLTAGKHVVRIRVLNEKNKDSKGRNVNIISIFPIPESDR